MDGCKSEPIQKFYNQEDVSILNRKQQLELTYILTCFLFYFIFMNEISDLLLEQKFENTFLHSIF